MGETCSSAMMGVEGRRFGLGGEVLATRGGGAPQPRVGGWWWNECAVVVVWRGDRVVEGFAHTIQRVIDAENVVAVWFAVRRGLWLRGCCWPDVGDGGKWVPRPRLSGFWRLILMDRHWSQRQGDVATPVSLYQNICHFLAWHLGLHTTAAAFYLHHHASSEHAGAGAGQTKAKWPPLFKLNCTEMYHPHHLPPRENKLLDRPVQNTSRRHQPPSPSTPCPQLALSLPISSLPPASPFSRQRGLRTSGCPSRLALPPLARPRDWFPGRYTAT